MSTTKTTLFDLAWTADTIIVGSKVAERKAIGHYFGSDRPRTLCITCSDGVDYHFVDQDVTLLVDGEGLAFSCCEERDEPPTRHRLRFRVNRPLTASDVRPFGR